MNPDVPATVEQVVAAERIVLGAMMTAADAVKAVDGIVTAADFYRSAHATIHAAIVALHDGDQPHDPVAVAAHLNDGTLTRVGGMPYLSECYAAVPTAANAAHYARLVAGAASLRRLDAAAARIAQLARTSPPGDAPTALETARDLIARLGDTGGPAALTTWKALTPVVLEAMEQSNLTG